MEETAEDLRFEERLEQLRSSLARLREAVGRRFIGHPDTVELLLTALLADGHVLLEGLPGLGKTTLVKELACALELSFQRIQFTPDLMPADILGARILESTGDGGHTFRFEPGPIFAHVVLADEINRATPRTQSALLEAMQERQVTLFGETRELEAPFCVIATQNPVELEGTYPLPEAQVDRFVCKIELSAPNEDELCQILDATTGEPEPATQAVIRRDELLAMRRLVRQVEASSDIVRSIARLVILTDPQQPDAPADIRRYLRYGASPRGGQSLLLLAKARALQEGRPWVSEDDVASLAAPALRHRLIFSYEGEASGVRADDLVAAALAASTRA